MTSQPIALADAFSRFDALWSPRILAQVNDYDVRIAKVRGEHVWHAHDDTDELFLVVDGELSISLREPGGEREVVLPTGDAVEFPDAVDATTGHPLP